MIRIASLTMRAPRLAGLLAVAAGASLLCSTSALAGGTSDYTKRFSWTFAGAPGPAPGVYYWDMTATAKDNHIDAVDHPNSHASFNMGVGLPYTEKNTHAGGPGEPESSGLLGFFVGQPFRPDPVNNPKKWKVNGFLDSSVTAATVAPTPAHGPQTATSTVDGKIVLPGGRLTFGDITNNRTGQVLPQNLAAGAGIHQDSAGGFHDPISLVLEDLTSGQSITEQLLSMEVGYHGLASSSLQDDAIYLNAALDGVSSASMVVGITSSWVTNFAQGTSSVSLTGGMFTATGIFAALPWQFTGAPGSITSATVPSGFSLGLDYTMPLGTFTDGHDYSQTLVVEAGASVASYAVPAPGSLFLAGLGGLLASSRRRLK